MLQEVFALTPAVCSRYIRFGLSLLLKVLRQIPEGKICWPTANEFPALASRISAKYPLLQHAFGFADGLNLPVEVSGNSDIENAYYNGWTCQHYCSSVFTFASDGTIIHATLNAPGSWHDAMVAGELYNKLRNHNYFIVADTAFPHTRGDIRNKIKTPIKTGDRLPSNRQELAECLAFSAQVVSARQAAEWGMRAIQGSFGRLRVPLPIGDSTYRLHLLECCIRSHQVRTRLVGVNQIAEVYESNEYESNSQGNNYLHNTNRIARFYNIVL